MFFYWIMAIIPMLLSVFFFGKRKEGIGLIFVFFIFYVFLIGLRDKVGMDWNNYLFHYYFASLKTFPEAISGSEPGFSALNWIMASNDMGVYGVNVVSALVFTIGVFSYARYQCIQTWPAIAVVMPYLVIVIAMSATRQAMAIGIFLFALAHWQNLTQIMKCSLILFAFLFHASAIVFLGLLLYEAKIHTYIRYPLFILLALISYPFLSELEHARYYQEIYIEQNIFSSGSIMHLMLNVIPALLYFGFRKKIERVYGPDKMLYMLAILSLISLPASGISSTGIDRISLYFSAIQMKVYSAMPFVFSKRKDRIIAQLLVFGFTLLVLFIWLNYSNHAFAYLPYRNYWID